MLGDLSFIAKYRVSFLCVPQKDHVFGQNDDGGGGGGWWLWLKPRKGRVSSGFPPSISQQKPRERLRGHLEQSEVWSPGLFNVSSNELDDETESMLINFIDDTQLRLEGAPWRTGLEFKLTPAGFRDWSETSQMRFTKFKGSMRIKQPGNDLPKSQSWEACRLP
jgi:hypothetical protein